MRKKKKSAAVLQNNKGDRGIFLHDHLENCMINLVQERLCILPKSGSFCGEAIGSLHAIIPPCQVLRSHSQLYTLYNKEMQ